MVPAMIRPPYLPALFCLALSAATPAVAATGAWGEGQRAEARLIAAGVDGSGRLEAGVEIRLPEGPDYLSAYGLTIEDVSGKQWDRISVEAKCLTEDYEWHDGLLWLRCHRARIIAVTPEPHFSNDNAIWRDDSATDFLRRFRM